MKLLVLQIENRNDPMLDRFLQHNQDLSKKHGFEHVWIKHEYDASLPPWWWKVFCMRKLMSERPDVDLMMWLDSDAFLCQYEKRNPQHLAAEQPDVNMWVSPDAFPDPSEFNAGSYIVRNNAVGHQILDEWVSLYDATRWTKSNGRWKSQGPWAGLDYEQGSFAKHLLPKASYRIQQLPSYVLNHPSCRKLSDSTISVHLYGDFYKRTQKATCFAFLERQKTQQYIIVLSVVAGLVVLITIVVLAVVLLRNGSRAAQKPNVLDGGRF